MSRCFPYPPPGYVRNGVPGEALIESIKLHKRSEKPKLERSKEKREKRDKKKDKKRSEQQGIPSKVGGTESSKLIDETIHGGKKRKEDPYILKGKVVEAEPLEKSGLTEEHEQPINLQTPCYLSDSTRSSHKRKRQSSPSTSSHASPSSCSRTHGNVLRIRLPQKQREPDALLSKDQQCSTSGRINLPSQQHVPIQQPPSKILRTDSNVKKLTPKPVEEVKKSTPKPVEEVKKSTPKPVEDVKRSTPKPVEELLPSKGIQIAQPEPASRTKPHKDERRWAKLCSKMEAFVPLSLPIEQDDGDDQWLFGKKPEEGSISKKCRAENDGLCNGSLWPRAQYLPAADIYALPYTIPF